MGTRSNMGGSLTVLANGPRLKELRKAMALHWTQPKVEDAAKVARGQLTRYENSKPASITDIIKLARFYECPPNELVLPEGLQLTRGLLQDLATVHGAEVVWPRPTNGATAPAELPAQAGADKVSEHQTV